MFMGNDEIRSWFEKIKSKSEEFLAKIDLSPAKVADFSTAFGAGFFAGFFIKKFGRPVIILFIFMLLGLGFLQHLGVIVVDWMKLKTVFGITRPEHLNEFAQSWYVWAKDHVPTVAGAGVGFLVGYKLG